MSTNIPVDHRQPLASERRPVFILRLRPEPAVADPTRALRWALKTLLRKFGLRAVSITVEAEK